MMVEEKQTLVVQGRIPPGKNSRIGCQGDVLAGEVGRGGEQNIIHCHHCRT